jgi:hypothetical protein
MIIVRVVFQAEFGKGGELAARFAQGARAIAEGMGGANRWRILTDLSGPFDTVVQEVEYQSLADWEQSRPKLFALPAFREAMGQLQELVVSGHNEMWTVEAEG